MLKILSLLFLLNIIFGFINAKAADCTLRVPVQGAISAATWDFLTRAEEKALDQNCSSILLEINTPGGDLLSTRKIVEQVLASPVPYLCIISPSGAHAGSAGAIIMQACHVSGGIKATNLGAATPILGTGQEMSDDLRKKMINDTVSWLEGVTKLRGRNLKFSEEIITEAKAVSIDEAVRLNAIDFSVETVEEFLKKAEGRKVTLSKGEKGQVHVGVIINYDPDLRTKVLSLVADPEIAYLMFMGSIALLYFEITHPGTIAPGVIGGVGLILSLVALHKLEMEWAGLALILLGIAFLIGEMFIPSFGILGVGGLVSFILGSIFLFDQEVTGYAVDMKLIFGVAFVLFGFMAGIGYLAMKTLKKPKNILDEDLSSHEGVVVDLKGNGQEGLIEIVGETWKYQSSVPLTKGQKVKVLKREGLLLKVEPKLSN